MASSRFPNKPLAKILNIPMVGHCYFRSKMSKTLDQVFIATCDKEIADYAKSIGAEAIMTSKKHERASDRTAEAISSIEKITGKKSDIVVMIQGDEPMLRPEMIDAAVKPLIEDSTINVVNLVAPLKDAKEHKDINEIKVVVDINGFALYFSREPIPSIRKGVDFDNKLKQVCIIPFRRDFLFTFNKLEPTPLEIAESVDMLRVLEHGFKVKMIPTPVHVYSVDTEEDRKRVEYLMRDDELVPLYSNK